MTPESASRSASVGVVVGLQAGQPAPGLAGLAIAAVDEDAIGPGLEARRLAQLGQVAPHAHDGLLGGVLGQVQVGQDVLRDPMQPAVARRRQRREGFPVTALRTNHQRRIHPHFGLRVIRFASPCDASHPDDAAQRSCCPSCSPILALVQPAPTNRPARRSVTVEGATDRRSLHWEARHRTRMAGRVHASAVRGQFRAKLCGRATVRLPVRAAGLLGLAGPGSPGLRQRGSCRTDQVSAARWTRSTRRLPPVARSTASRRRSNSPSRST